ncbi:hypothetical protein KJA15_04480 [Patescibacteria group bacterium]|nr:hypothetical protein [Patescibacteria group bacterium]
MDTKKGFLIIGIILIIISAISLIFGYLIRELWPTTNKIYEIGIPSIIGTLGVIFFGISSVIFFYNKYKEEKK